MQLPEALRTAIENLAQGVPASLLSEAYTDLSSRYRREAKRTSSFQVRNHEEALAYTVARLPATYGAASHVLKQASQTLSGLLPKTLLDCGSGPGTATYAALECWPQMSATLIEPNKHLREISRTLLEKFSVSISDGSLPLPKSDKSHDLIIVSYVLNEMSEKDQLSTIHDLWQRTGHALILIEPGMPLGFSNILRARQALLREGAFLAAPCPHILECPLAAGPGWCHMSERVSRTSLHRKTKSGSDLPYEDEKFSYLVASRHRPLSVHARLIGHPHGSKLVSAELCMASGNAEKKTFSKRDQLYKTLRKAEWGDAIPPQGDTIV